jgi:hypothetical protein
VIKMSQKTHQNSAYDMRRTSNVQTNQKPRNTEHFLSRAPLNVLFSTILKKFGWLSTQSEEKFGSSVEFAKSIMANNSEVLRNAYSALVKVLDDATLLENNLSGTTNMTCTTNEDGTVFNRFLRGNYQVPGWYLKEQNLSLDDYRNNNNILLKNARVHQVLHQFVFRLDLLIKQYRLDSDYPRTKCEFDFEAVKVFEKTWFLFNSVFEETVGEIEKMIEFRKNLPEENKNVPDAVDVEVDQQESNKRNSQKKQSKSNQQRGLIKQNAPVYKKNVKVDEKAHDKSSASVKKGHSYLSALATPTTNHFEALAVDDLEPLDGEANVVDDLEPLDGEAVVVDDFSAYTTTGKDSHNKKVDAKAVGKTNPEVVEKTNPKAPGKTNSKAPGKTNSKQTPASHPQSTEEMELVYWTKIVNGTPVLVQVTLPKRILEQYSSK